MFSLSVQPGATAAARDIMSNEKGQSAPIEMEGGKQKVFESTVKIAVEVKETGDHEGSLTGTTMCTLTLLWNKPTRHPFVRLSKALRLSANVQIESLIPETVVAMDLHSASDGAVGSEVLRFVEAESRVALTISLPSLEEVQASLAAALPEAQAHGAHPDLGTVEPVLSAPSMWSKISRRILLDFFRYWDEAGVSRGPDGTTPGPTLRMQAHRGQAVWPVPTIIASTATGTSPVLSGRVKPNSSRSAETVVRDAFAAPKAYGRPTLNTRSSASSHESAQQAGPARPSSSSRWRSQHSHASMSGPGRQDSNGTGGSQPVPLPQQLPTALSPVKEGHSVSGGMTPAADSSPSPAAQALAHQTQAARPAVHSGPASASSSEQASALAAYALMQQQLAYMSSTAGMPMATSTGSNNGMYNVAKASQQVQVPFPPQTVAGGQSTAFTFPTGYPVYTMPAVAYTAGAPAPGPGPQQLQSMQQQQQQQQQYVVMQPMYGGNGSASMPVMYVAVPQGMMPHTPN